MRMLAIHQFLKLLFTICLIVSNRSILASQHDSLFISNQFKEAFTKPNQRNAILKSLKSIEKDTSVQTKTWYYTELVKFNIQIGNLEEAEKEVWKGLQLKNPKSNASQGVFYNLLASIKSLQKEYDDAIKYFQKSIEIHTQHGNLKAAAYVKNNIANIFFSLADYESAHKYISEAHQTVLSLNDTLYLPPILGVLAVSEVKLNRLQDAKKNADLCLKLSAQYNNVLGEIIGNYTLGEYWSQKSAFENSLIFYSKSQEIAEKSNQLFYVMLSKIGISHVSNKTKQFDNALMSGKEALAIAEVLQNKNVQYTILKQLSVSYFGKKNFEQAYLMLEKAHEILRTNADEQNRRIINDILIQYETAEKEKELIANRLMIKSQELESNRLKQGIGILIVIVLIALIFFVIQRKLQLQTTTISRK
jgi:two-component system, NarL family, sensor kinase